MAVIIESLSKGEALLLRRLRADLTQVQMAKKLRVPVDTYRLWETDVSGTAPKVKLGKIKFHEAARILRRRSGLKQWEVARDLGVSRMWVLLMESGKVDPERLLHYWSLL